jgi:hypothetical protein
MYNEIFRQNLTPSIKKLKTGTLCGSKERRGHLAKSTEIKRMKKRIVSEPLRALR